MNFKRIIKINKFVLCVVLSVALCVGLVPGKAFADTNIKQNDSYFDDDNNDNNYDSIPENDDADIDSKISDNPNAIKVTNFNEFVDTVKNAHKDSECYINLDDDIKDSDCKDSFIKAEDDIGEYDSNCVIDGCGHTLEISKLHSLFKNIKGHLEIKNLNFHFNIYIWDFKLYHESSGAVGGLSRELDGTVKIKNCNLKGKIQIDEADCNTKIGALIGKANEGSNITFEFVNNYLSIINSSNKDKDTGGLLGESDKSHSINIKIV